MGTLTEDEFRALFLRAIDDTIDVAQAEVAEPLPRAVRFVLDAFGRGRDESSLEEVLALLYRDGTFPRVVDVFVRGVASERTIIKVSPSGHAYVSDVAQTWNNPPGMGPFKSLGFTARDSIYHRPRPLSRQDLEEAAPAWAKGDG